jgi:type II secretory pathway pseudopilin PulG
MTLVELLTTMVILGVIGTVLASTLWLGFRHTRDNQTQLDQSNAEQLTATYFAKDVQESASVGTTAARACPGATGVAFQSQSRSTPTGGLDTTAVYELVAVGPRCDLVRTLTSPVGTFTNELVRGAAAVTAACVDAGCAGITLDVTAAGSTADPGIDPYQFTIEVRRRVP